MRSTSRSPGVTVTRGSAKSSTGSRRSSMILRTAGPDGVSSVMKDDRACDVIPTDFSTRILFVTPGNLVTWELFLPEPSAPRGGRAADRGGGTADRHVPSFYAAA